MPPYLGLVSFSKCCVSSFQLLLHAALCLGEHDESRLCACLRRVGSFSELLAALLLLANPAQLALGLQKQGEPNVNLRNPTTNHVPATQLTLTSALAICCSVARSRCSAMRAATLAFRRRSMASVARASSKAAPPMEEEPCDGTGEALLCLPAL